MITRHSASVVAALLFLVTSMVSVGVSAQSLGDIPASQRERLMPQIQAATENAGNGPSEADTANQERQARFHYLLIWCVSYFDEPKTMKW